MATSIVWCGQTSGNADADCCTLSLQWLAPNKWNYKEIEQLWIHSIEVPDCTRVSLQGPWGTCVAAIPLTLWNVVNYLTFQLRIRNFMISAINKPWCINISKAVVFDSKARNKTCVKILCVLGSYPEELWCHLCWWDFRRDCLSCPPFCQGLWISGTLINTFFLNLTNERS